MAKAQTQQPERYITAAEAAARLGKSLYQTRAYLREGKLKGARVGRDWRVSESAVEAALRSGLGA